MDRRQFILDTYSDHRSEKCQANLQAKLQPSLTQLQTKGTPQRTTDKSILGKKKHFLQTEALDCARYSDWGGGRRDLNQWKLPPSSNRKGAAHGPGETYRQSCSIKTKMQVNRRV